MDKVKQKLRTKLKSEIDISYIIRSKPLNNESMKKKEFLNILKALQQIEDRRDFMSTELGIDVTQYEDKFFQVIESLFKLAFSQKQLELIRAYLYELWPDKSWDGKITLEINKKKSKVVDFKTPEQVWEVIKDF